MSKLIEVYELNELDDKIRIKVIDNFRNRQGFQEYITEELQDIVFEYKFYLESKKYYDVRISWSLGYCQSDHVTIHAKINKEDLECSYKNYLDIDYIEIEVNNYSVSNCNTYPEHYEYNEYVEKATEKLTEELATLARKIYKELREEDYILNEQEYIEDFIKNNEFMFTKTGIQVND